MNAESTGREISLSDHESDLAIRILSRTHATSDDYWDGNWLTAHIAVRAGAFGGAYSATLRSDELDEFRRQLESFVRGEANNATYQATEEWLQLELGNVGQDVVAQCECKSAAGSTTCLSFAVKVTDPQALGARVAEALEAFPVIGDPGSV